MTNISTFAPRVEENIDGVFALVAEDFTVIFFFLDDVNV